jgi:hypothetical protein
VLERAEHEQTGSRAYVDHRVLRLDPRALEHAVADLSERGEKLVDLLLGAPPKAGLDQPLGPFVSVLAQLRKNWK